MGSGDFLALNWWYKLEALGLFINILHGFSVSTLRTSGLKTFINETPSAGADSLVGLNGRLGSALAAGRLPQLSRFRGKLPEPRDGDENADERMSLGTHTCTCIDGLKRSGTGS